MNVPLQVVFNHSHTKNSILLPAGITCRDLYQANQIKTGKYKIRPDRRGVIEVFCDQISDGGGNNNKNNLYYLEISKIQ